MAPQVITKCFGHPQHMINKWQQKNGAILPLFTLLQIKKRIHKEIPNGLSYLLPFVHTPRYNGRLWNERHSDVLKEASWSVEVDMTFASFEKHEHIIKLHIFIKISWLVYQVLIRLEVQTEVIFNPDNGYAFVRSPEIRTTVKFTSDKENNWLLHNV